MFFLISRVLLGFLLVAWGIFSFIFFFLPGGIWTIVLGLAILAIDIPWCKKLETRVKEKVQRKFPRFYRRILLPVDNLKEKIFMKISASWNQKER